MTDDVAANIRNERRAPPAPSTIKIECNEPTCDRETTADQLPGDWQASNNPNEPILCPECADRVPNTEQTVTEYREASNKKIGEYL